MNYRIRRNGELYLVPLSKEGVKAFNLREGDEMEWTIEDDKLVLRRRNEEVTAEFMELLEKSTSHNEEALRELKDR